MRTNRLSVVHLVLDTSTCSVVYHELARCSRPLTINIKLTASCWPIVHHKCTGCLRLGVAIGILLKVVSVRWLILLLLVHNCSTSTVIYIKLAWFTCVDAYLEALLADGFLVVESEVIWASGFVDHEVAGASRAIVDHELATCTGSIIYRKLIWPTTSIIYHKLTTSTRPIINRKLIWATCSVVSDELAAAW